MSREAYSHITAWLEERPVHSDYIFTAFDGRGSGSPCADVKRSDLARLVRKYTDTAGLTDVKPHDFRRFVGTQLARAIFVWRKRH